MKPSYSTLWNALFPTTGAMNRRGRRAVSDHTCGASGRQQRHHVERLVSKPIYGGDTVRSEHQKEPIPYPPITFISFLAKLSLQFVFSWKTQYPVVMTPSQHFLWSQLKEIQRCQKIFVQTVLFLIRRVFAEPSYCNINSVFFCYYEAPT